ncbi:TetR-like C-terminal domain-containing protein [Bradyrhizobium sp. F1.13.3]|uniref:TetR-like C-terminal domain-containing protein n=1 Tax=Bradyrhizobium sp. F1.13.3 TaxID=3156351 RepID=UPI003398DD93
MQMQNCSVEEILSRSWDRKIAHDLLSELEAYTGERLSATAEMRRFLACKGYRDLLERLQLARNGRTSWNALRSVAYAMREYALESPALSAATFRTPVSDCPEWREAHARLCEFMRGLFAECGLNGGEAELALCTLRSLVRGFVVHEVMGSFVATFSYTDAFEAAVQIFLSGMSTLSAGDSAAVPVQINPLKHIERSTK